MKDAEKKDLSVGSVWRSSQDGDNNKIEFLIVARIHINPLNESTLSDSLWVAIVVWNPVKTCNTHIFDDYGKEVNMYRDQCNQLTSRRRKTSQDWDVTLSEFTQHNMDGQEYEVCGVNWF